jgi:pimeloyl-ACP methyl ester carboxylesterase
MKDSQVRVAGGRALAYTDIGDRSRPSGPSRISVPVDVVHGDLDTLVPIAHSRHTARLIPGSTFRALPGHGHLTILSELPRIAAARLRST